MYNDLVKYYRDRAREYERIYHKPERQADLRAAEEIIQNMFLNEAVFEISCGTGYWTEKIASVAQSIFATDINESMLEIAQAKTYGETPVVFGVADIYTYMPDEQYNNLFGGFIWSHIPLQQIEFFLAKINTFVTPGSRVVFIDNNFVEGSNIPVSHRDEFGNTFQTRNLDDGSVHQVLKNFPDEEFFTKLLDGKADDLRLINLTYFWILSYKVPA